jgi:hypothetical protein
MTQEEFEQVLKGNRIRFERAGDEILVTHQGSVYLNSLESLPPGVRFENQGDVWLNSLESLPPDVRFENQGNVRLPSLKILTSDVRFENNGDVWLSSLERVPPGVQFQNQGSVRLNTLVEGWFDEWAGNIEGVDHKRLLNLMIDKKLFV